MKKSLLTTTEWRSQRLAGFWTKLLQPLVGVEEFSSLLFLQSHCTFYLPGKYHEMPWGSRINYNLSFSDVLAESGSFTVNCSYWSSSSGMTNKLAIPSSLFFFTISRIAGGSGISMVVKPISLLTSMTNLFRISTWVWAKTQPPGFVFWRNPVIIAQGSFITLVPAYNPVYLSFASFWLFYYI